MPECLPAYPVTMNQQLLPISPYQAELPRKDLKIMIRLVQLLNQLSENSAYQALLNQQFSTTCAVNHGHAAVMMGYDFHLTPTAPKLIEVNTNAGGLWFAQRCYQADATHFSNRLGQKLLQTFFNEYALFSNTPQARPKFIAIVDENPQTQFLYPEMLIFSQLFQQAGIESCVVAPEALLYKNDGLYFNNQRIDMIYNRHCDFYLESAAMSLISKAWQQGQICLSPNPRAYSLLADKQRMILWSDEKLLAELGLTTEEMALLKQTIPQTLSLADLSPEQAWQSRKQWVFKPETGYGSRGVYVGDKLTKGKLSALNPANTLIQKYIPPSVTRINDNLQFKTDFRLFVYQQRVLAVSARLYQGQVTNLRTENGGFAKVHLTAG